MNRWTLAVIFMTLLHAGLAQHENDLLFGVQGGALTVIQPQPHPVRTMAAVPGAFLLDVGVDFYYEGGAPQLRSCRIIQRWISPGLVGSRSGMGQLFCVSGCPNFFDLPTGGTAHHHFIFSTATPGVYIWDCQAVNGIATDGVPVSDMPWVYRIYMVAGNPARLYGEVSPASDYVGNLYSLTLTVQVRQMGQPLLSQNLPPNVDAIYPYMVGFNRTGSATVIAKLSKHLSRRLDNFTLGDVARVDWQFPYAGDINGDDVIDDADLLTVLFAFGQTGSNLTEDVNGDGTVDDADLLTVLFNFGLVGEGSR
ncbi:hypothetical protein HRbin15_01975 [bacterium HR15]|nr:hypothetical protein HRbin15_01975 [bacterium HR15]